MKSKVPLSRRQFVAGLASTAAVACLPKSAFPLDLGVFGATQASGSPAQKMPDRVAIRAVPFPLANVRLLKGPFLDAANANLDFMHSLPVDRLVYNFRSNANLPVSAVPLGGWEDPKCELRGHFTGHYLSACALGYATSGDSTLRSNGEAVVDQLAKCQKAMQNGYLSAFPETFFDRLSEGQPVWAPFYTLHKILAGNIDMYTYCGNEQALANAEGLAQWIGHWTNGISDDHMQRILKTEYGGTNEALYNLFAITGKGRYFETARRFEQPDFFNPLAEHRDELKGLHVNTHIPKVIGAARRYELTADPHYRDISAFFWETVTQERAYVTGGTSNGESWNTEPGNLAGQLSMWSEECCCGYNMLKLTRHLHQWTGDPRYFDYYERTLFNSRLGTEHPENGMKMYYLPLQTGGWKYFHSRFNSFWCCSGTGVEEFSKLTDSIYFHNDRDIFVNLFISSEVRWPEKGLTLTQKTSFPEQEGTSLSIKAEKPVAAAIAIRIPSWAVDGGSVEVNGKPLEVFSNPGSYLEIDRTWTDGDRVELKLPMRLHSEPLLGDRSQQAALYGPIVLAGRLGADGLTKEMIYDQDSGPTRLAPEAKPVGSADIELKSAKDLESAAWIEPVKGETLTFRTVGQKAATTLIPLHRLFDERYAVYWKVSSPQQNWWES
ncbi:MAG: beta-L-arabinofuranosidase domain-containing protein [Candidatus Acidiferrales bacterium]